MSVNNNINTANKKILHCNSLVLGILQGNDLVRYTFEAPQVVQIIVTRLFYINIKQSYYEKRSLLWQTTVYENVMMLKPKL